MRKGVLFCIFLVVAGSYLFYLSLFRLPGEANRALDGGAVFTIFSLHPVPYRGEEKVDLLHGYRILGQTVITNQTERALIVRELRRAVRNGNLLYVRCFDPRHGIRVEDAGKGFDYVICFECQHIHIYKDGETNRVRRSIIGSPKEFNAALRKAKIPLAPTVEELSRERIPN